MKTFSYGEVDAYNEEQERRERWNRATVPIILLGIIIVAWVAYGALLIKNSKVSLDDYIEITAEVKSDGIHYKGEDFKGIRGDYIIYNRYGYEIGETIVMYHKKDNPFKVYVPHKDDSWMLAFPLAVLTLLDLWWLFKMMTPKKKHYIPQEK